MSGAKPLSEGAQERVQSVSELVRWVMDRAAAQYIARGLPGMVEFEHGLGERAHRYIARACWSDGEKAPHLAVYAARTGDFVCRSLEHDWFEAHPVLWNLDFDGLTPAEEQA